MTVEFHSITPILRIFDIPRANAFYLDYLGFKIDWSSPDTNASPLYRQVSRGNLTLHLSEHHGDGSPGIHIRVAVKGLETFHAELRAKEYEFMRPGIEDGPGGREVMVMDPFGNRITFCEAS